MFGLWEEAEEHTNATRTVETTFTPQRWSWGGADVTFELRLLKRSLFIFEVMRIFEQKKKKNASPSSNSQRKRINKSADLWPLIKLQNFMPKIIGSCFCLCVAKTKPPWIQPQFAPNLRSQTENLKTPQPIKTPNLSFYQIIKSEVGKKMSFSIHHVKVTSQWISTLSSKPEHMLFQSSGTGLSLSDPEKFLFKSITLHLSL